jgi:phage anti-repressor protein
MSEIITITTGTDGIETVNARELHTFLEVGKDFSSWMKDRISQYDFVKNRDYTLTFPKTGERKNVVMTEYHVSLDMAKELSMVERNDKGREARQYFIKCEKLALEGPITIQAKLTTRKLTAELRAFRDTAKFFGIQGNNALISANAAVKKKHGVDMMDAVGVTHLIANTQLQSLTPTEIGKRLGVSAKAVNKALESAGIQYKTFGKWAATEKGYAFASMQDTVIPNGTVVKQLKWLESVIDIISSELG